ncbi:SHOCT domain-containing protein [Microbacterium sp. G2-8]|uniref:SHOCT domain-containing protein n=1 Tax=Microbacterium sp. G2-8 TaxID=2842454 RepID=UPI001C88EFEC|nr:SHOCT domain-containing protein [Microbacterium sp. G2-8]
MSFWESFWDIIWWMFWIYVFIAYLMALFSVLIDVIRDHSLKGWAKAIWIVFLVFVPFLTVLVYLIARGSGMGERSSKAFRAEREASESYIRDVAGTKPDPAQQIEKASQLLASGAITEAEFAQLKAKALA